MNQKSTGKSTAQNSLKTSGKGSPKAKEVVLLPKALTVRQLAEILGASPIEVIKSLMRNGIMANINQVIPYESAAIAAASFGYEPQLKPEETETSVATRAPAPKKEARVQKPRPPVITILGHVDHGKTTLLDAIRHSNITESEVGAITQHIGAYQVEVKGEKITFIDTPGHEAFTAMRARGAKVTDIAVLVVAADDGVMPQTIEAINHARAAEVPIVVAINKIDKPNADLERVKHQLAELGLLIEEWGGDVICVPISAKTGEGISELLENLLVVAEISELKADPEAKAEGVVIEAKLDNTRGPLATVLVQNGTLKLGDIFVVGNTCRGKVKAMFDDNGNRVKAAGPSMPVEIMGLEEVPQAGDPLVVVESEQEARKLVEKYREEQRMQKPTAVTLGEFSSQIRAGETKGLNLILKTDVQGSIEPIKNSLERLGKDEVKVRVIHSASGSITESDVMLAIVAKGIIVGFNTRPEPGAKRLAESEGVEIRIYQVIYELVEDIKKALAGLLEPTYVDITEGRAEVRAVFNIRAGKVAGVYVTEGKASRGSLARVLRGGQPIYESRVSSLKHFKEHVSEMPAGSECGVGLEGFSDFEVGDIIEFYRKERR